MEVQSTFKRFMKAVGYLIGEGEIAVTSSAKCIAEKLGWKNSNNMSAVFKADPVYFTEGFIKKFCEAYPSISVEWVLNGSGKMVIINKTEDITIIPEDARIKQLEARIAAMSRNREQQDKAYELILSMLDVVSKTYSFFENN